MANFRQKYNQIFLVLFSIVSLTLAFELHSIEKSLAKEGLHRDMLTQLKFRIDSIQELSTCSIVVREQIPRDCYIYLEELRKFEGFDFYPQFSIDIEKPAMVSEPFEMVWKLPLKHVADYTKNYIEKTTLNVGG